VRLDRDAEHPTAAFDPHRHRLAFGQGEHGVIDRTRLPAADVEDQARDVLDVVDRRGEVHATLEAVRGVGREVVAARAATDRVGPPERGLHIDVACVE
jgi:hypothetical protein